MCHHIIIYIITLQWQCIEIKFIVLYSEDEKNHKRGGGGGGFELCFQKLLSLRSEKLFPDSESEIVQSLTWVQSPSAADNNKRTEKERKNTSNYTGSFHKPEVVLSPLHFQGEFH